MQPATQREKSMPGKADSEAAEHATAGPASVLGDRNQTTAGRQPPTHTYDNLRKLVSILIHLRGEFRGDLELYIIYFIVAINDGANTLRSHRIARSAAARPNARGINALSISEITGIPRETVRRKLKILGSHGYVLRKSDQLHYLDERRDYRDLQLEWGPLLSNHGLIVGETWPEVLESLTP